MLSDLKTLSCCSLKIFPSAKAFQLGFSLEIIKMNRLPTEFKSILIQSVFFWATFEVLTSKEEISIRQLTLMTRGRQVVFNQSGDNVSLQTDLHLRPGAEGSRWTLFH